MRSRSNGTCHASGCNAAAPSICVMSPSARSAANGGAAPRGRVPPCTLAPASAAISARSSASPSTCASGSPSPPTAATSMHEWPSPSPQPRTSSSRRPHHRARAIELYALVPRSPPEHRDDGSMGPLTTKGFRNGRSPRHTHRLRRPPARQIRGAGKLDRPGRGVVRL